MPEGRICSIMTLLPGAWHGLPDNSLDASATPLPREAQALNLSQPQLLGTELNSFSIHWLVPLC